MRKFSLKKVVAAGILAIGITVIPLSAAAAAETFSTEEQSFSAADPFSDADPLSDAESVSEGPASTAVPAAASAVSAAESDPSVAERLAAIEQEEQAKRAEKERALKSVLFTEMLKDFGDAFGNAEVYFLCIDGQDYVAASDGNSRYVYLPRMTKQGEYFISDEGVDGDTISRIDEQLDESHLSSTDEFWNKIALAEKPVQPAAIPQPVDGNGVMMVPYYNQSHGYFENGEWTHTDWPSTTFYDGKTLSAVGCGFTATAMALSYCTQEFITPVDLMGCPDYNGNGANGTIGVNCAADYNVPAYQTSDYGEVLEALKNRHPVMVYVGQSAFTSGTHYILLVGVLPDGTVAVNDPSKTWNTYYYCGVTFDASYVQSASLGANAFTIFG